MFSSAFIKEACDKAYSKQKNWELAKNECYIICDGDRGS